MSDYLYQGRTCPVCLTGVCNKGEYLCRICQELENERRDEMDREVYESQFDEFYVEEELHTRDLKGWMNR